MSLGNLSEQEIREQLELILNDAAFSASSRLKKFFRFIVEETLAGNAGQLKAYTIATTVFDRNKDFDPLYDPVVRVETAKLRNRLMEYYFSASSPGNIRIEVPKGGYVPTFSRHDANQASASFTIDEFNAGYGLEHGSEHASGHSVGHGMERGSERGVGHGSGHGLDHGLERRSECRSECRSERDLEHNLEQVVGAGAGLGREFSQEVGVHLLEHGQDYAPEYAPEYALNHSPNHSPAHSPAHSPKHPLEHRPERGSEFASKLSTASTQSSTSIQEKARKTSAYAQISVALLPFINLSGDNIEDDFISGLADEITVALTRFEDMSIVSSYSTRNLNSAQENIYSLAEKLGVRFMLHGSVQCNNKVIRVRVELADAHTGSNLWAERFDAKVDNKEMFSIQEEIAQCLVSRIGDSFGSIRRKLMHEVSIRQPNDLELYETLLSYHHWMPTFDPDLFKEAKLALEKALVHDPNDPVVVASLADLYASDYQLGYNTVPDALNKAQEFALRAIAMDGTSQTAYWALALVFFLRRNRPQFEKTIKQVVPLNPANSYMLVATGLLIGLADNIEEGLALMERAMELNPASPGWMLIVSYCKHYTLGNFEAALNDALLINTPGCFWDPMLRAAVYGQLAQHEEAKAAVQELLTIQPDFVQKHKRYIHALAFSDKSAAELETGLEKAGLHFK